MALFKFLNGKGRYRGDDARTNVAEYILNPYKAKHGYIGGAYVNMESIESIVHSMDKIAQQFGKTNGVQLRHFVLSFLPQEARDPRVVCRIGREIMSFVGQKYQAVFAVHENTANLHIHFMLNSVSHVNGDRYYGKRKDYYIMLNGLKKILHRHGIHTLIPVSCNSGLDIQD